MKLGLTRNEEHAALGVSDPIDTVAMIVASEEEPTEGAMTPSPTILQQSTYPSQNKSQLGLSFSVSIMRGTRTIRTLPPRRRSHHPAPLFHIDPTEYTLVLR
ncbi:unnamed protein product [Lactuca virosa]|uniref:Uncharacterized protein n=1 Tax=Lactuca virosa TaxID=75947 RepID=A0AAU9PRX8_9ASTR|nr:unnamed protein product [Lactuca virosa]